MILLYTLYIIPSNYLRIVGGDRESTAARGSVPSRSTGVRGGCARIRWKHGKKIHRPAGSRDGTARGERRARTDTV